MDLITDKNILLLSYSLIIFLKIICLVVAYLIIRLGYNLIASGVKGEFKFSGKIGGYKADLISVSPGLLFVFLGVLMVCYAISIKKEFRYKEETGVHVKENYKQLPIPQLPSKDKNK
jgi:hypothetical protein